MEGSLVSFGFGNDETEDNDEPEDNEPVIDDEPVLTIEVDDSDTGHLLK